MAPLRELAALEQFEPLVKKQARRYQHNYQSFEEAKCYTKGIEDVKDAVRRRKSINVRLNINLYINPVCS